MTKLKRILSTILVLTFVITIFAGCGEKGVTYSEEEYNLLTEQYETDVAKLTDEKDALAEEKEKLSKEIKDLKESLEEMDSLKEELDALKESEVELEVKDQSVATNSAEATANVKSAQPEKTTTPKVTATATKAATSSTTSTGKKSGLDGCKITVLDSTTPAASCTGYATNGVLTMYFISKDYKKLGSFSEKDYTRLKETGIAPMETSEADVWFADQFNIYRGLGSGNAPSSTATTVTTGTPSDLASLINSGRSSAGLHSLTYDSSMQSLADTRAMELDELFSHTRPDGTSVMKTHYYAEIACYGNKSAQGAYDGFYNSTGHKNIMLSERYNYFAVGVNGDKWVVLFSE